MSLFKITKGNKTHVFKTIGGVAKFFGLSYGYTSKVINKGIPYRGWEIAKVRYYDPNQKKETPKDQLLTFKNPDKKWHEKWQVGRGMMNIPHPFRCVLCGPPNCGKTSTVLNLIAAQSPEFKLVVVIHCDPEHTKEYDGLPVVMCASIPSPDQWDDSEKTLVILDDLEYKTLIPPQKKALDRLFGYVSTHRNVSVCLTAQDVFNTTPSVRRMTNVWCLWKLRDMDCITILSRKMGIPAKTLKRLFEENIEDSHDFILVDNTHKSPYPIRKNGVEILSGYI